MVEVGQLEGGGATWARSRATNRLYYVWAVIQATSRPQIDVILSKMLSSYIFNVLVKLQLSSPSSSRGTTHSIPPHPWLFQYV